MAIETKRMWDGGPLRYVSDQKENNSWINTAKGEFRGMYGCDRCRQGVVGVYRVKNAQNNTAGWLCSACREAM